ncbi:hypothetical protein S2M10_07030 [Sphingomonas sp. S2M10]|nr:hypothetical protein [Sphingomonas sp. S2M10]
MAADPISLFDRLMAVKPESLSANAWTERAGVSRQALSDIKRRGNANHSTIEKLLDAIGITFTEFEAGLRQTLKEPPAPAARAPRMAFQGNDRPRDIPVLGTAECADIDFTEDSHIHHIEAMSLDLDEVIDHARRPASLDNRRDVYAIYFRGHSMAPRYESGEIAYVDPHRPPKVRDYVIVQMRRPDGDEERVFVVLAKRLVRISASYFELEQFNPATTFRVPRADVKHIHRIIPWDEIVGF